MAFKKATKKQAKARIGLMGPAGAGKTYTSLTIATNLGEKVAVIDTERGSASKYADEFDFDVMELDNFHPQKFIDGIREAEEAGYEVLIIDSLSHAWMGKDGALELVDQAAKRSKSGNSFGAWREVTPLHNSLVDAMLGSKLHIIVTMRTKTEYVVETVNGKQVPRKIGLAPVQRDGLEYEFDIVGDIDFDNTLVVTKTRCRALSGAVVQKPGKQFADTIKDWLTDGKEIIDKAKLNMVKHLALENGVATSRTAWNTFVVETTDKTEDELTNADIESLMNAVQEAQTAASKEEPTDEPSDEADAIPPDTSEFTEQELASLGI